jgi:ATP-dependent Lhr-like helicase
LRWHHLTPQTRLEGPAGLPVALEALAGFSLPSELAERDMLARRLRHYDPSWLDRRISDGEWVFTCAAVGNSKTPRAVFWPRADLAPTDPPPPEESAEGRVLQHLATRGASFYTDLWSATGLDANALGDALWSLLVAGKITNDRFEVVRRGRPAVSPTELAGFRAGRASRVTPRFHSGRWSIAGAPPADPEWWAHRLLDRYGVVAREHVAAEEPPVAWGALYDEWKRLEMRGEARRGYFIEGLSGTQFAWPVAVDRLRADPSGQHRDGSPVRSTVLTAATDPACAWGPILAWELPRLPSNFVVIEDGLVRLVLEAGGRRVRTATQDPEALTRAAAQLATLTGAIEIADCDGAPVEGSPLAAPLRAAGFEPDGKRLRKSPLRVRPLEP